MERVEELYPDNDLSQLKSEFLSEVPQTPTEAAAGDKVAEEIEEEEEGSETQATEAPPYHQMLSLGFLSVCIDVPALGHPFVIFLEDQYIPFLKLSILYMLFFLNNNLLTWTTT